MCVRSLASWNDAHYFPSPPPPSPSLPTPKPCMYISLHLVNTVYPSNPHFTTRRDPESSKKMTWRDSLLFLLQCSFNLYIKFIKSYHCTKLHYTLSANRDWALNSQRTICHFVPRKFYSFFLRSLFSSPRATKMSTSIKRSHQF